MSVWVIGAGGHAAVVIATLRASGEAVAGLLDDDPATHGTECLGVRVDGPIDADRLDGRRAVMGIGSNRVRHAIAERLGGVTWVSAVHPAAVVHDSVTLGPGAVVFAGAVVQPRTQIGRHVILNTGCTVDHDCDLGDAVHVAPGVHLAGGVALEEGAFMGIGSAAIPGVRVGAWSTVGAGGVVVSDLPGGIVATGVPARPKP